MGNWLDRTISYVSPRWGAQREAYRTALNIQGSYNQAVATRRSMGWSYSTSPQSMWALPAWELLAMRNRCRSLERNNAICRGMLDRCVDNVIGTGLTLQVTTEDPDWNQQAEDLMNAWFDTADISGLSWIQHQRLIYRSNERDGDVGVILLNDGRVQAIEGDLIKSPGAPSEFPAGIVGKIIQGIEINDVGRVLNYYIDGLDPDGDVDIRKIAAENFIFLKNSTRLTQLRGEPCFAQTAELFDQIDGWIEALTVNARLAACIGLLIKKNNPQNVLGNLGTTTNGAGQTQRNLNMEPGMVHYLEQNEDVVTINPNQPQQSFPDSLAMLLRIQGLPLGLPLEITLMDFSRTSYNSARAALQQAYRAFLVRRRLFTDGYLARLTRWRISKFIKDGKLKPRPDAWRHRWIGQPWPYLDPLKEAQAVQMQIDTGTQTITGALREQGMELATWIQHRGEEIAAAKKANIPLVHHTMSMPYDNAAPATQAPTGDQNEDEERQDEKT